MIPNSIVGPAVEGIPVESLELYKRGTRNVLWLTVREGRRFILKGLPEELRAHPEETVRLRKEYSLGLRISHPGVAGVYGFETHPAVGPVIVMEYVDGTTLDEYLSRDEHPTLRQRVAIASQIAEAMAYMHSLGISHRDLKPDNILVTRRNEAKIIDIGLGDSEDSVVYKQSVGTESFGAPEQQAPCVGDSRADVYSFGMILGLLLPERKFKKLREACLQDDPEKRIGMSEVVSKLNGEDKSGNSWMGIVLLFALVAILATMGVLFFKNASRPEEGKVDDDTVAVATADVKDMEGKENIIGEDVDKRTGVKEPKIAIVEDAAQRDESMPSAAEGDGRYEEIYEKYMAELTREMNRLGRGFDQGRGEYIDSIVQAKAIIAPDIMNRMVSELERAGCPYDEMTRLCNLMYEKWMDME